MATNPMIPLLALSLLCLVGLASALLAICAAILASRCEQSSPDNPLLFQMVDFDGEWEGR